jgi:hypothetical protein
MQEYVKNEFSMGYHPKRVVEHKESEVIPEIKVMEKLGGIEPPAL